MDAVLRAASATTTTSRHAHSMLKDRQLDRMPSDYMRERFPASFITDPYAVENRHYVGVERMLWSSDYPAHHVRLAVLVEDDQLDVHRCPRRRASRDPRRERAATLRVRSLSARPCDRSLFRRSRGWHGRHHRARPGRQDARRHRAQGRRLPAARRRPLPGGHGAHPVRQGRRPRRHRSSTRSRRRRPGVVVVAQDIRGQGASDGARVLSRSATTSTTASTRPSGSPACRSRTGRSAPTACRTAANTSWQVAVADPPSIGAIAPTQSPID